MCIPLCLRVPILYHACTACEDLQRGIWNTGHSQPSAPNAAHQDQGQPVGWIPSHLCARILVSGCTRDCPELGG